MSDSETKVLELGKKIADLRAEKHANHEVMTNSLERAVTDQLKSLSKELVDTITSGSEPCSCGATPHGMIQYAALKNRPIPYYEIGCLNCKDKRAQGFSLSETVLNWNNKSFIK